MENYNIYDEIGRGTHSFVYKARRKRSIEYVAVKSTAKSRMDKILNEVPFLHRLDSRYVCRFFDWYESSNHIWLILEYCMGGDLLNLITQDKQLPEATVKAFGLDLVAGLQYLHSNSILYCDLKPANILIDEFGSLKLADFGLARRIPAEDSATARELPPGSPHYMAPELFQQPAVHSFASDFWALGCVLYELRTGRQPFTHTNFSDLARMIQTDTVNLPVSGYEMSPAFCHLLDRLLVKDPYQRITWEELVGHPFWDNLPRLEIVLMPAQEIFDRDAPVIRSNDVENDFTEEFRHDSEDDGHQTDHDGNSHAGNNGVCYSSTTITLNSGSSEVGVCDDNQSVVTDSHPGKISKTSDQIPSHDEARPMSASSVRTQAPRSNNAILDDDTEDDLFIGSSSFSAGMRQLWRTANAPHSAPPEIRHAPLQRMQLSSLFDRNGTPGIGLRKVSKLIFTPFDCRVKSIIGNKDVKVGELPRVQVQYLQFELKTPEALLSCTTEALENQLKEIYISIKSPHADDQEKLSVMAYLFSLSCHARLAHVIVNSSILKLLVRMLVHEARLVPSDSTMLSMVCLILGILFRFATIIAPSSPDQLRLLVKTLLEIVGQHIDELDEIQRLSPRSGLQSRPLALACLGELLFYISTQQEWELPMGGVEGVLACVDASDILMRYYAVRTLDNMLIHCTDSLLPTLMSDKIVLSLIRGLLQNVTMDFEGPEGLGTPSKLVALRTTTTEALAQVLRHLRTPSSLVNIPSRLKRSIMLFFAKPEVLSMVWQGVQSIPKSFELSIASLNIINGFLDMKLGSDREADTAAIKASRTLLLERVMTFPKVIQMLEIHANECVSADEESLVILRAKSLIALNLGMQLNRSFLLSFVQNHGMDLVENVLASFSDQLSANENNRDSTSSESKLSAFGMYLAQCALNMCKLAIRMALKLGADCFYSHDGEATSSNNTEQQPPRISSIPFALFSGMLQNPNCRQQLMNFFVANDTKHYTFFLRLMAKLLTSFPEETLHISGNSGNTATVAVYVSGILLDLFKFASSEANTIVLVEKHVLFTHVLPIVAERIFPTQELVSGDSGRPDEAVAVNCLQILRVVLLDFDYEDDNGDYELYDSFIRLQLLPHLNSIPKRVESMEKVWSLSSELLFGLLSNDSSLLGEAEELQLVPTIIALLSVPAKFKALPSHATQLIKMLIDSVDVRSAVLYESGIAKSMVAALSFASARERCDGSLVDLILILMLLLHEQYEMMRQPDVVSISAGFEELVRCGRLMVQLCTVGDDKTRKQHTEPQDNLPENNAAEADAMDEKTQCEDEVADLASRCLVYLSQVFGEQLNEVMFLKDIGTSSLPIDSSFSSLLLCLQMPNATDDGTIALRVLLTLRNCLRCEGNHALVSQWLTDNKPVMSAVKALASRSQPDATLGGDESQPNRLSVGKQTLKTATAILHFVRSSRQR